MITEAKPKGWLVSAVSAKALTYDIPLAAMLELTNHCNLWCRHCYVTDRPPTGELTLDEFRDILAQLAEMGTLFLTLSGGEALVHPHFFEIATYARKKEFSLVLFTNGTLISPAVADRLRELCLERVELSILGGQASTHDGITGTPGSFDRAVRGARLLCERGVKVQLKTTWMRENILESAQIFALVDELGASFRGSMLVVHRRDGSAETTKLTASAEQLRQVVRRGSDQIPAEAVPPVPTPLTEEQKRSMIPCGAGQNSVCIDSYGSVHPCAGIDTIVGNLRAEKFASIWRDSVELKKIKALHVSDLTQCADCDLYTRCNRCAGLAKMETGSLLGPSPQACRLAHAFEDFYHEKRCELH